MKPTSCIFALCEGIAKLVKLLLERDRKTWDHEALPKVEGPSSSTTSPAGAAPGPARSAGDTAKRHWTLLVRRYESERGALVSLDGDRRQGIAPQGAFACDRLDLSARAASAIRTRAREVARRPFGRGTESLICSQLVSLATAENMHHIIRDGRNGH